MSPSVYALLADLLTALETDGSAAGPDLHLRLQALVRQLPEDTRPEDLKTLLAPVLCRNKEEQERFYELFARSWARVQEVGIIEAEKALEGNTLIQKVQRKKWLQRRLSWSLWLLLGLVAGLNAWAFFAHQKENAATHLSRSAHNIRVGEESTLHFDTLAGEEKAVRFSGEQLPADSSGIIRVQLDSTAQHLRYTALRAGIDSLQIHVHAVNGSLRRQHTVVFNVLPSTPDTGFVQPVAARDTELYKQRPLPYPRDLSQLLAPQPTGFQQFLSTYEWPLKGGIILCSGLLLGLLAQWSERRRRQLIAEHQPNAKPPYVWNIRLDTAPEVDFGESFYSLLHQLRRRETDEQWRLDMPRTIRATIRKGGLPELQYAQQTRPAEYLLLIDRQGARDHRARLFEALFQGFRAQEVIIEAYYFDGDPRLCWNDKHPNGLTLRELYYHYPQARLLLLGSGWSLLNPQTGRLAKWTNLFSAWTDRAILTPQPLTAWSRDERALRKQFLLLPATLSGLRTAVDYFDADDQKEPDLDPRRFPDAAAAPIQLVEDDLISSLQLAFKENQKAASEAQVNRPLIPNNQFPITNPQSPVTTWVAACAVYPELHWDLTLYLGRLLSTSENNLLTAGYLAELCRLPWFVEGKMPKEARERLLAWLEREQPATLLRVREALHQLLSQYPPPSDSAAHDDYALNMALNEWLLTRDRRKKKQLEKEVAARLAAGQEADFTVIKVLDRPRGPLDFVVPKAWRRFVYPEGLRGLGVRAWWWAGLIWLGIIGATLWWQPAAVDGCKGKFVTYKGIAYCLKNPHDEFLLTEVALTDAILEHRLPRVDSILDGLEVSKDLIYKAYLDSLNEKFLAKTITDYSIQLNLVQAYFNSGVYFQTLNQKDTACLYFNKAQETNINLPDTVQLWYVRSAAQTCTPDSINPSNPLPPDIVLRGQMLDAATNLPIPENAYRKTLITAKGLPPGYLLSKGQFRVDLPGGWKSPVYLTFSAPGYQATAMTVPVAGFEKNVVVRLQAVSTQEPDADGDGIPDGQDKCPQKAGFPEANGCPTIAVIPRGLDADTRQELSGLQYRLMELATARMIYNGGTPLRDIPLDFGQQYRLIGSLADYTSDTLNFSTGSLNDMQDRSVAMGKELFLHKTTTATPQQSPTPDLTALLAEINQNMLTVPAGTFTMGCDKKRDGDCNDTEKPAHEVTLSGFAISKYELTQRQWEAIMGSNPSGFKDCPDCPVEQVSWNDVQEFLQKLNQLSGRQYRLPTEAEWEYAARGGAKGKDYTYSGGNKLLDVAWYEDNSQNKPHTVGSKIANEQGLYDMSGNVWEWCADFYGDYTTEAQTDPRGPDKGAYRVIRGGGWFNRAGLCRAACRNYYSPPARGDNIGFRLARSF